MRSARIAICGAHAVGKTTLGAALADAVPGHVLIEEPYYVLADAGYIFEDPPVIEDFEAQLECSLDSVQNAGARAILDRCPADFLAYLAELAPQPEEVVPRYWSRVVNAMARLDTVIYVPVEHPDRMRVGEDEHPRLRRAVDRRLRQLIMENELGIADRAVEVLGSVAERVKSVLRHLKSV